MKIKYGTYEKSMVWNVVKEKLNETNQLGSEPFEIEWVQNKFN